MKDKQKNMTFFLVYLPIQNQIRQFSKAIQLSAKIGKRPKLPIRLSDYKISGYKIMDCVKKNCISKLAMAWTNFRWIRPIVHHAVLVASSTNIGIRGGVELSEGEFHHHDFLNTFGLIWNAYLPKLP